MSRICIDRCVCFARPFPELYAIAQTMKAKSPTSTMPTLDELQEETAFGLACRICNPYVRRMLRTGETSFDVLLTEVDEPRQPR